MTERSSSGLTQTDDSVAIGPSAIRWDGESLTVSIREIAVPHITRLEGTVRVIPEVVVDEAFALDDASRHWWRPVAPRARIEVAFRRPDFRWSGAGYLDMNWGAEPLEAGFRRWDWARAPLSRGAAVIYDATRRDGSELSMALRFDETGGVTRLPSPPRHELPRTLWRVPRAARADVGYAPTEARRYEDAPFYARAELQTRLFGEDISMMHETVDGDRFASAWVKRLLPFRMPRALA